MFKQKKILSLIVARAGSKGLKNKNIKLFRGKPLIQWTMEAAKKSKYIDYNLISTDSKKIIALSRKMKIESPFKRPQHLSGDNSSMASVILHALRWVKKNKKEKFDFLLLLQGTSPLRTNSHIDSAIKYYFTKSKNYEETLVSVNKMPLKIGWLMKVKGPFVKFLFKNIGKGETIRRQNLQKYFLPNGAIFFSKIKGFRGNFYKQKTLHFEMNTNVSIDIDHKEDIK